MSMFDTFDRTGAVEFPFARDVVMRSVERAGGECKGMKVGEVDKLAGHVTISTGASAFSWGERVTVSVLEVDPRRSRVQIGSATKTIMGSATAHGKNRRNVQALITKTSQLLEANGSAWATEMGLDGPVPHHGIAPSSDADEIKKLAELRDSGVLTEEEFQAKKQQVLGL